MLKGVCLWAGAGEGGMAVCRGVFMLQKVADNSKNIIIGMIYCLYLCVFSQVLTRNR